MQRKSPRGIPDFSRQSTRPKDPTKADATPQAKQASKPAPPSAPRTKPQGTSAKSGRGK